MASVLPAAGLILRIDFIAAAGYSLADPANISASLGNIARAVSYSTNISVHVSIANVQIGELSASSITAFVVSVDAVVSPPLGTPCPPGNVTLVFECFFTPLRASAELKSAVDATYRTSTALSSVLGNPVTAMSNTGMVSILTLEECVFSDIDPLDASVSPVPWAVGDQVGQYYRGGVLITIVINVVYFAVVPLFSAVVPTFIPGRTRADVLGLVKYPSSVMIFVGMFHQGMVSSSVSLLRLALNPTDVVLGSSGLVVATSMTAFMLLAGTRWRKCHVAHRSEEETHSSVTVVQLFLHLALWKQHWVDDVLDDGTPSGYKRRYLFILDDVAVSYWAAVELTSGLAQGAILGVRKNDVQTCQIQRIVLAAHCFVMVAASLILRPCGSFFGNLFLIASKLGSFVVSLLIVIHTMSGSEEAHQNSQLATAVFSFVSSLQTVIQVVLALVLSRKSLLMLFRSLLYRIMLAKSEEEDTAGEQQRLQATMLDEDLDAASQEPYEMLVLNDLHCGYVVANDGDKEEVIGSDEGAAAGVVLESATVGGAKRIDGKDDEEEELDMPLDGDEARRALLYEKKRQSIVKFLQESRLEGAVSGDTVGPRSGRGSTPKKRHRRIHRK